MKLRRALASRRSNQRELACSSCGPRPSGADDAEFSVEVDGRQVAVTVAACPTVLAVLDAIAPSGPDGQLPGRAHARATTREVGDSVLARAMQPEIKPVDRWDLVQDAFGALRLDPALTRKRQPLDRRGAARRAARGRLAAAGRDGAHPGHRAEPAGRHPARHRRRRRLAGGRRRAACSGPPTRPPSRASSDSATTNAIGLVAWLAETTGGVADVVFAMAAPARSPTQFRSASRSRRSTGRRRAHRPQAHPRRGRVAPGPRGGALPRRPSPDSPTRCRRSAWRPSPWSPAGPTTGTRRRRPRCASGPRRSSPSSAATPRRQAEPGQPQPGARSRPRRAVHRPGRRASRCSPRCRPRPARRRSPRSRTRSTPVREHGRRRDRDAEIRAAAGRRPAGPLARRARGAARRRWPTRATRMLRSWALGRPRPRRHRPRRHQPGAEARARSTRACGTRRRRGAPRLDAGVRPQARGLDRGIVGEPTTCCCVENLLDRIARPVASSGPRSSSCSTA